MKNKYYEEKHGSKSVDLWDEYKEASVNYQVWFLGNAKLPEVRYLLKKGADVNAKDNNGWTALMHASYNNHTKIVKLLLEKGANK